MKIDATHVNNMRHIENCVETANTGSYHAPPFRPLKKRYVTLFPRSQARALSVSVTSVRSRFAFCRFNFGEYVALMCWRCVHLSWQAAKVAMDGFRCLRAVSRRVCLIRAQCVVRVCGCVLSNCLLRGACVFLTHSVVAQSQRSDFGVSSFVVEQLEILGC